MSRDLLRASSILSAATIYKLAAFDVHAPASSPPPSMSAPAPTKNVIVLGGGGAGVTVAQTISKKLNHAQYNLVLVDQRPHMIWLPASARMVVTHDEEFKDTVRLPATSIRSAIWNFACRRPCFRMTRSSRKERELSSWYITFPQPCHCSDRKAGQSRGNQRGEGSARWRTRV